MNILSSNYTINSQKSQGISIFKKTITALILSLTVISSSISALFLSTSAFAASSSTNNFYFTNSTFDYYLEPSGDTTKMHVVEVLTAVFPETNQNHGITRAIPYTNQDGKNTTIKNTSSLNLSVTRNGVAEKISKTEKKDSAYIFYIGDSNTYVHGEQTYILEYDFYNVITEFDNSKNNVSGQKDAIKSFQELYWDTNGTGWSQRFDNLTATLHLDEKSFSSINNDSISCYVGHYGASGKSSRCETTSDPKKYTVSFKTTNLKAGENLTFAIDFKPNTFPVAEPLKNYTLVIVTIFIIILCIIILAISIKKWLKKGLPKRKYYKNLFIKPEYVPLKNVTVAEAEQLLLKSGKKSYVATLLELAVSGKIVLVKGESKGLSKKPTWKILVKDTSNLTTPQKNVLKILNGSNNNVYDGLEIEVKKHTATSSLASLAMRYSTSAVDLLREQNLLEGANTKQAKTTKAGTVITVVFVLFFIFNAVVVLSDTSSLNLTLFLDNGYLVGKESLPIIIALCIISTIISTIIIGSKTSRYSRLTEKGLDANAYLEGLRLYIKMAEQDRIKFLHSVEGADTSNEGIVKLYEKLLPYAILFGLEDSWMENLNKYYQLAENYDPTWYSGTDYFTIAAFSTMNRDLYSSVYSSSTISSSSSSSSGGGGGGFSGGGGGGGGGGGW
ncbi:DUF2207 domain-containing protein [Candidatus Saccharibacteria bacterium]|nr:DUF2207 domain-containing protein [Candidatus Saccharibacteria bacterium]